MLLELLAAEAYWDRFVAPPRRCDGSRVFDETLTASRREARPVWECHHQYLLLIFNNNNNNRTLGRAVYYSKRSIPPIMGGGQSCHPMIACAPHSPAPSPAAFRPSHFVEGPTTGDTSRAEIQTGTEQTYSYCVLAPLASPMIQTGPPLTCRMELGQRYKQDPSKHTLHVCSILGHIGPYWIVLGHTGPY